MAKNYDQMLDDKFNRQKTRNNDLIRISSIHKKIKQSVYMLKNKPINLDSNIFNYNKPSIYNFHQSKTSAFIKFDTSRENENDKIPKIELKDVPIPQYSINDTFDLNKIKNMSQHVNMDIFASDNINDDLDINTFINSLRYKNIHKIYHVYQEKYPNNVFPTGLGDFIRSCFFIIQFCSNYNFQYRIIINHPIALFLNKFSLHYLSSNFNKISNKVSMFTETNWSKSIFDKHNNIEQFLMSENKFVLFVKYLTTLPVTDNSVFSYNIFFPFNPLTFQQCNLLKSLFEPTKEMSSYLDITLTELNLTKNNFITIHIRSGDSYLKGESKIFNPLYFDIIKNEIIEVIFNNKEKDVLLIADNNEIKCFIKELFPHCKVFYKNITHLGEGVKLDVEKVKNTLLDFYLMSLSYSIHSFTSYPHGSGFSYWCAKMYGIPYKCKYINIKSGGTFG